MKIACFGDSLTFGAMGYSYIKYLNPAYTVVNKGVNGDTTICAAERLKRYLDSPAHGDVDVYVVAIGTNDLLLPYLTTVSPSWRTQMKPRVSMKKCILDDALFESEYRKILELVQSRGKTAVAVGLPLLQLAGYPNERGQKRSLIIKKLAADYGVFFVDAALLQRQAVQCISFSYSWKHKNLVRIADGAVMLLFPFSKDWFSKLRRLELTVDGVHFNSRSARLVGDAVGGFIARKYGS